MNWRTIGIICGVILLLAISVGITWKMIQKSESYKADQQEFYTCEPHFFIGGCASYRVMQDTAAKKKVLKNNPIKPVVEKAEVKK